MDARRTLTWGLALAGLAAAVHLSSCSSSKDSSPTAPSGGSVSFTFSFPDVGSSSSQVFATAGNYPYHCIAHQGLGMTGTVVVDAGSAADSAQVVVGAGGENLFTPATVTIKPGGLVRWSRPSGSAANHTATR